MKRLVFAVSVLSVGAGLFIFACGNDQGPRLEANASQLFFYSGTFRRFAEQPESVTECGDPAGRYDTSGFFELNREEGTVRLQGLGCKVGWDEQSEHRLSATAQPCLVDGVVSYKGIGLDELVFESMSLDLEAMTTVWRGRAFRTIPDGRVTYCFELEASVDRREAR